MRFHICCNYPPWLPLNDLSPANCLSHYQNMPRSLHILELYSDLASTLCIRSCGSPLSCRTVSPLIYSLKNSSHRPYHSISAPSNVSSSHLSLITNLNKPFFPSVQSCISRIPIQQITRSQSWSRKSHPFVTLFLLKSVPFRLFQSHIKRIPCPWLIPVANNDPANPSPFSLCFSPCISFGRQITLHILSFPLQPVDETCSYQPFLI